MVQWDDRVHCPYPGKSWKKSQLIQTDQASHHQCHRGRREDSGIGLWRDGTGRGGSGGGSGGGGGRRRRRGGGGGAPGGWGRGGRRRPGLDADCELHAAAAMASRPADEVVGPGGLEGDGGGAAAVGADGVRGAARVVVALAHFVHGVASSVVEHCQQWICD